ncbi:ATP-binding protein [Streptomyces sp. NPDC047928]|uniref:ATP-binding protein n=1 Tax=unclassified Streptomyces TaxID=2593676 RepID=UPI0037165A62
MSALSSTYDGQSGPVQRADTGDPRESGSQGGGFRASAFDPDGPGAGGPDDPGPDDLGLDVLSPGGFAACGLDGRLQNAAQARRFVSLTLDRWALPSLAGDMGLIVSELVTNAVKHGLTQPHRPDDSADYPLWLGLFRHPGHLVCSVADPSPEPPRPRAVDVSAPGGRGLALVTSLSDTWSWSPTPPCGKTVWASMRLPG